MKFKKFLKECSTYGEVINVSEDENWLVCCGVGMLIPRGVNNLLGTKENEDKSSIIYTLLNADFDDELYLKKAILLDPTGNAKQIYRVFESELGEKIGITNSNYGLLEKSDRLGYCEVVIPATEDKEERIVKYILVFDCSGTVLQGFIAGSQVFEEQYQQ